MSEGLKRARAAARATRTTPPSGARECVDRAEDNRRYVRETLAARDPEYARTLERTAREARDRQNRQMRREGRSR